MIKAECHSDDHNIEVNFDATPWFKQATEKQIQNLDKCEWGGDYPADEVAIWMANHNKKIARMFSYLETIANDRSKKDVRGFECHINKEDAARWIFKNRRDKFISIFVPNDRLLTT